jgi:hypothetical protein
MSLVILIYLCSRPELCQCDDQVFVDVADLVARSWGNSSDRLVRRMRDYWHYQNSCGKYRRVLLRSVGVWLLLEVDQTICKGVLGRSQISRYWTNVLLTVLSLLPITLFIASLILAQLVGLINYGRLPSVWFLVSPAPTPLCIHHGIYVLKPGFAPLS